MKKKIEKLFANLCCSHCKNSFDENSITIKREEEGLTVIHKCELAFNQQIS